MKLIKRHNNPSLLVLTITAMLLFYIGNSYSQVYKSVDENGKITFSDTPAPSASEVEVREPNTVKSIDVSAKPEQIKELKVTVSSYDIAITHPQNNSVIANGLVPFTISTKVAPTLQKEHQLQLTIDGSIHSTSKSSFKINGIARGEHSLRVAVIDGEGKVLKQSKPIKIFVHRPSKASNTSSQPVSPTYLVSI